MSRLSMKNGRIVIDDDQGNTPKQEERSSRLSMENGRIVMADTPAVNNTRNEQYRQRTQQAQQEYAARYDAPMSSNVMDMAIEQLQKRYIPEGYTSNVSRTNNSMSSGRGKTYRYTSAFEFEPEEEKEDNSGRNLYDNDYVPEPYVYQRRQEVSEPTTGNNLSRNEMMDAYRAAAGIDLDSMSFLQRLGGTLGGIGAGAGKQIASSGLGLVVSDLNRTANRASEDDSLTSYKAALEQAARSWYQGLVNGADYQENEDAIRRLANYVGGESYADQVVARVRERARQAIDEGNDTTFGLLDDIVPDENKVWENSQKAIADSGIYDAMSDLQNSSAEDIQYAKAVNPIQSNFGDSLVEAGVSAVQNAADALIAAPLVGVAGPSALAMIPFALRAYGGTYSEQIQQATDLGQMVGKDVALQAAKTAGISSAIEVGTEMMWGMVGSMSKVTGGGALDDAAQEKLSNILSGWAKTERGAKILTTIGEKALGGFTEGLEEIIGDAAEQILKNAGIMPGEAMEFSDWMKQAGHSFVTGALAGLIGEASNVVATPMQRARVGKQLKSGGITTANGTTITVDDMVNLANSEGMEGTSLEKTYSELFKGVPRATDSFTDQEMGKLYEAYEETMGRSEEAIDRVYDIAEKVQAGKDLTRADVNRITNNPDAVRYLQSAVGTDVSFDGNITERKAAVEMALRTFANDNETLSGLYQGIVNLGAEDANTAELQRQAEEIAGGRISLPGTIAEDYFTNSTQQAVRDAAQRLGIDESGQNVLANVFTGQRQNAEQAAESYLRGRTGGEYDVAKYGSQVQAYDIGRQEYRNELTTEENNGRTEEELRVRSGVQGNDSQSAGGQSQRVEEAPGSVELREGTAGFERRRPVSGVYSQPVSAASLGIRGGSENRNIRVLTNSNDKSVQRAQQLIESRGYKAVLFTGGALEINGEQARGYYDPETNTIYVRADHRLFTAEQIAQHEVMHDRIRNGEVDLSAVKDDMIKRLGGTERFERTMRDYYALYEKTGMSFVQIFEEAVCDAAGNMNEFLYHGHWNDANAAVSFYKTAKESAKTTAKEGGEQKAAERGSLGKASIDLTADALGVDAYRDAAGKVHFRVDGREVKEITAEHVKNRSAIGVLIKAGEASKFITAAEANEQYQAAADLMNMIMSTQDPEMIWAFSGATMFSALKKNSDGQYGTTIDFTTVCRKTQEMVTAMSNAMREAGRGLTKKEVTDLQHDVLESGAEVPCPVCYVFSRWAGIGGMLDDIVRLQDKYAKFTKEQITARTNELKKEIIARGLGSKDKKGRPTVTGSGATALMKELEAEANDAKAKIEWYEDGKKGAVTEAEYKRLKKELPAMQENIGILSEWTWSSQIVTRADYKAVPKDILFDLDAGAKFASEYPAVWKYRTTRGPSSGKAILPYSSMRTGDIITGAEPSATVRGLFTDIVTNKSKMRGKMTKKQDEAYQKAVLRTAAQNLIGGQRYQSTSDFRYEYALDYIQSFWELQALGSKLQTYTKVVEYADIIAAVGGDVNLSVMPLRSGVENGKLIFSNQTGMNIGAALEANRKFDNAQLILVGINDEHILAALDDHHGTGGENIGFVIPYHASGASITDFISELVKNLGERFVNSNYRDYSAVQNDKEKADRTAEQIMRAEIRKKLLTGKSGVRWNKAKGAYESNVKRNELTKEERDLIRGKSVDISGRTFEDLRNVELKALAGDKAAIREYLSWSAGVLNDLYEKMYNGTEKDTVLNSSQAEHIMPHEYWNTNTTRANAYVNGFIFRSYCYSMGLMPRFSWTVGSGENAHGDLSGSDGYWKTLIDRPMYNNDGTYRAQQRINVTDFNNAMLKPSYAEKTYPKYKIQEPNRSRAEKVGTEFGKKISGKLSRDIDTSAFTESQLSNYNYNQKQTETGSTLKTLGGSAIKRSKYGVGKDIGGRIYMHRDYADSVIPEDVYESAKQALAEAYPDFDYNCVEWSEKDGVVRFDEAPGFDTEREPIVGDYVTVNPDGTTKKGHTDYIWHHKWLWVKDDYKGFDVRDAWEWSKDWLSTISGKTYEVNGKEYNDRGKSDGNGIGRWNAQLDAYGLPRDSAGKFSMDLDEDAAPVRQDHTSRGTSINTTKLPVLYKLADAKGGFKSGTVNIDIGAGVEGTPATAYLAERGVNSLPFDPFNRNRETNMAVMDFLKSGKKADTATCSNVLNVIDNEQARANVILQLAKAIKPDGTAYFTVYSDEKRLEAGKAGEVSSKPDQWQELRAAKTYVPEIKKYFDDVPDPKSGLIIARKPKANLPKATWQITSTEYTDKEGNKPYSKDEAIRFSRDLDNQYMAAAESGDTETAQRLVDETAEVAMGESVVRNPSGKLMHMYHGTPDAGSFNVFDAKKLKNETRLSQIGQGFYFTNKKNDAQAYTKSTDIYGRTKNGKNPHLFDVFLNVKNPFNVGDQLNVNAYKDVILDGDNAWFFSNWIPFELNNREIDGSKYTKAQIASLSKEERVDFWIKYHNRESSELLSEAVRAFRFDNQDALLESMRKHLGVDGIVQEYGDGGMQYVVFSPNQIKSADPITYDDAGNIIPLSERFNTKNDDIRYSRDLDSDGNKLSKQQAEYFKDSKVRDKNGNLLVMYHGTKTYGFTKFRYGARGVASFFTPQVDVAESYSGGAYVQAPDDSIGFDNLQEAYESYGAELQESGNGYKLVDEDGEGHSFKDLTAAQAYLYDNYLSKDFNNSGIYPVYLNIKKPYVIDAEERAWNQIPNWDEVDRAFEYAMLYAETGEDLYEIEYAEWGEDTETKEFTWDELKKQFGKKGAQMLRNGDEIHDVFLDKNGEELKSKTDDWAAWAEQNGYDGVIFRNIYDGGDEASDVYVTFNPEQVKSVYNQNPTENPDIRYSRDLGGGYVSYNDRALISNETVDYWLDAYAASNPNYAQAYVTYMKPADFLALTTTSAESRRRIREQSEGLTPEKTVEYSRRQPIQLMINSETGEVEGHEGRHRMVALEKAGITRVPVLLFDSRNKYSKRAKESMLLTGQTFDEERPNNARVVVDDVQPFSRGNADVVRQKFSTQTAKERAYERIGDRQVRFSRDLSNTELYEANSQLQKDMTELRRQLKTRTAQKEYWKGQTKVTQGRQLRIEDVTKLAREIIKGQESSADAKAVAEKMKALGEYLLNSQDENVYDEARLKAYEVAHDILANAKTLNTKGGDDFYGDFRTALKNQPIYVAPSVREEVAPDGWNDFRKAQFGTVNMTADQSKGKSVDKVYHDLQATFGEWLLPEYITSEADQLNKILEIIETYRPVYENLNSYEMADAVEWTANEILTRIIGEEIRETNPTYADRMEKKLADQKMKTKDALRKVRENRDQKVQNLKEHYQQMAEDRRNRKIDSDARTRLLNIAKRLNNKKLPRVTRALLDQYIGDLDLVSKGIMGWKVKELETLQAWYDSYKASMGEDFIPDRFIEEKIARLSKKHISDLTQEEVADLTTVLLNIENMIRTENELIESKIKMDTYAAGVQTIDDINNSNGKTGFLNKYISTETATPEREVHRITGYRENSPLYMAAKELSDGQRKMLDYQRRAEALFKKWTTDKAFIKRIAGKKAEAITVQGIVDGKTTNVVITPAMRMALYLHSKNDDNMRHIAKGGVKIPNMSLYVKGKLQEAYDKATRVVFTRGMINEIASHMTDKERAFADAVDAYYNGMSRDSLNDVSELLRGYAIAGVEHYYPIDTDGSFLKKEFDAIKRDGSIEGMGMLKERIEGASNPIMLYDINDTLNRSISQHSKYYGLAIPVRNFNRLYGVTTTGYGTSVAETLKKNWGSDATKYIEKMMADVQNGTGLKSDAWGDLLARARSHYAKAVLNTNASVAMKQAASYPTAAAVVGYGPLMKALADTKKIDLEKLAQYTPLLWYRSKGFSTTELGDIGKEGGHIPKALNWIQAIDVATTTKLAKAAMYYVNENNNLTRGTDAWWKAVAEVYNRIIEETQPNYTMMQRPQILRSDNALTRALNMFKTQPFQNFNILYDAFGNLAAKTRENKANPTQENKNALKQARTGVARAVSSQLVSAFEFAFMQFLWDAFRGKAKKYKDDDDEMTIASWLKGMGINVLSSAGGMLPFGSYALELGEALTDAILKGFKKDPFFDQTFYGLSENAAESMNDMGNALLSIVNKVSKALQGEATTESTIRSLVDSMGDIAQFAGIPVNNVIKLAQSLARNVFLATDGKYLGGFEALRVTTDPSKYKSDYYDVLKKAWLNDPKAYEEIRKRMINIAGDPFATSSETAEENIDAKIKEWKKEKAQNESFYQDTITDLQATEIWRQSDEKHQQTTINTLLSLAAGLDDDTQAKIDGGKSVGIDSTEYLLYKLALSITNPGGGNPTQGEAEAAARMVDGLTPEEMSYLYMTSGKNWKYNPFEVTRGGNFADLTLNQLSRVPNIFGYGSDVFKTGTGLYNGYGVSQTGKLSAKRKELESSVGADFYRSIYLTAAQSEDKTGTNDRIEQIINERAADFTGGQFELNAYDRMVATLAQLRGDALVSGETDAAEYYGSLLESLDNMDEEQRNKLTESLRSLGF